MGIKILYFFLGIPTSYIHVILCGFLGFFDKLNGLCMGLYMRCFLRCFFFKPKIPWGWNFLDQITQTLSINVSIFSNICSGLKKPTQFDTKLMERGVQRLKKLSVPLLL